MWRWLASVIAIFAVLLLPYQASAQRAGGTKPGAAVSPPGSTPVLTFETDDADEQADAFTTALRAKVKSMPGWTLSENTFSLGILTAALRCRTDAPCLQRVGDQLKTDKFFWGRVVRMGKTQVVVEAHYWQRAKHDSVVKETYSDDLRDPGSEALMKIATRVFERLTNTLTTGTVVLQAGKVAGNVLIDGVEAGRLVAGTASIELKGGSHVLEVRAPGYLPVRQNVNVVIGADTPIAITLVPEKIETPISAAPADNPSRTPSGGRRVLAYSLLGAGVVAGAVGAVFGVQWIGKKSDVDDLRKDQYGVPRGDANVTDPCTGFPGASPAAQERMDEACRLGKDAVPLSVVAWVAGGAGVALIGTGVVLLLTGDEPGSGTTATSRLGNGSSHAGARKTATPSAWTVTPQIGPREGTLRVGLTF